MRLLPLGVAILGAVVNGCICDGPVSMQFVSGINQVYFADSVAYVVDPVIQFTYEVESSSESQKPKNSVCIGSRKEQALRIQSFVLADSVKVTCNKDLPGTPAGKTLEDNPYVEVIKITDQFAEENHLKTYSFQSNWTVPSWKSMPDTAELTFHFKLNTGATTTKKNTIVFAK